MKTQKSCWDCNMGAVTKEQIRSAFSELGIMPGDTVLIHSSLRSFGGLEDGAQTVIDGIESLLGPEGTLVMPTLCQQDFRNSYRTWHMDKPSDVGWLTEYFRHLPHVLRSDQATHSVAARGKLARELTFEHTAYGPHLCPFGEYAFADSSPWNKMFEMDAHIVFAGIDLTYNTMKHLIEGRFAETLLGRISDLPRREQLKEQLMTFERFEQGIWPFYPGAKMGEALDKAGLVTHTFCGEAHLRRVSAKTSSEFALRSLLEKPEEWYSGKVLDWIREAQSASKE
ncbi:MAG: AAC(3) family N-acetyltransferase [Oscillospiraceae bacterium]|nr:AAC(3) family N-acetyltransferase [Oscillospiraceae bacterium]